MKWVRGDHGPSVLLLFLMLGALLVAGSCATVPKAVPSTADYLARLPGDADAILVADLVRSRELVEAAAERLGVRQGDLSSLLARARSLYGAAYLGPLGASEFAAIVTGRFSPAGIRAGLCGKKDWRRVRQSAPYFEHRASGVQVAAVKPGEVLLSRGMIGPAIAAAGERSSTPLPPDALEEADSALLLFLPCLPELPALAGAKVPAIVHLWLTVDPAGPAAAEARAAEAMLEVSLAVRLTGEREARLFRPVLRLLLLGLARQGRLPGGSDALAGLRDELDGDLLRLRGLRLTVAQAVEAVVGPLAGLAAVAPAAGGE